ncbi:MAG: UvrB/UvrC motif-containing protein [Verrucomicrobiota bacterium]|jgi:protein arginine kinase activator|nr:UvrB/UvrC motif-containing protein [Verrucomicrobiota bacterium]
MKCELCHKAEAETALQKETEGGTQEFYVCRACAEKEAQAKVSPEDRAPPPAPEADGLAALPLMGMILDAAFEIVGRAMSLSEPSCPVCGIQRHEYRKQSRLGCPACYEAFSKELDTAIFEMQRASQHAGKVPKRAEALWQRKVLEEKLGAAVKDQRYEEAIALRDELRKLDAPAKDGKEGPA